MHASSAPSRDQTRAHTTHHTSCLSYGLSSPDEQRDMLNAQLFFLLVFSKNRGFLVLFFLSLSFVVIGGLTQRHKTMAHSEEGLVSVSLCSGTQRGSV